MATHNDYNIADQTGVSLLTDLNDLLDALRSNSSDTVVPASFIDYQFWVDTTTNILKLDTTGGTISICNIDTGLFFGVASVSNADALDGLTTSTNADSTNVILRRDANGAVTGDMISGDVNGDAGALGSAEGTPEFIFDSANLTGIPDNSVTAGTKIVSTLQLATDVSDYVYYKPYRTGVMNAIYRSSVDHGTIRVMAEGDATQDTVAVSTYYYIANTGGISSWTGYLTGASSVSVGDIYPCHTLSTDLDTDLGGTGCAVIPLTDWIMTAGSTYTTSVTIEPGDSIIFDLSDMTLISNDALLIGINEFGWETWTSTSTDVLEWFSCASNVQHSRGLGWTGGVWS